LNESGDIDCHAPNLLDHSKSAAISLKLIITEQVIFSAINLTNNQFNSLKLRKATICLSPVTTSAYCWNWHGNRAQTKCAMLVEVLEKFIFSKELFPGATANLRISFD